MTSTSEGGLPPYPGPRPGEAPPGPTGEPYAPPGPSYPPPGQGYPPPGYPPPGPGYPPPGYPPPGPGYPPPGAGPQYGYGGPAGYGYEAAPPYAGYWARVGGWLIDWVILLVVGYIIEMVFSAGHIAWVNVHNSSNNTTSHVSVAAPIVQVLIVILYGAFFCGSSRGQTIGMMAVGVRAVDRDNGQPIGFARALGRGAFEYLMFIIVGIGWVLDMLWPAWDRRHQTLHDKVTRTIVVKAAMVPPPR